MKMTFNRSELAVENTPAEMYPGFSTLSKEDQTLLQTKLGTFKPSGKKVGKKRKGSAVEETTKQNKKVKEEKRDKTKEEMKEEEALKVSSNVNVCCIAMSVTSLYVAFISCRRSFTLLLMAIMP